MLCRLYLDNCSLNRPYDDQGSLKIRFEAEAKTYIQQRILDGACELAWSYILDYEIACNPFPDRKSQIMKWKNVAVVDIGYSPGNVAVANALLAKGIKPKDALHIACALEAGCSYFITTDEKLTKKRVEGIGVINPLDFIRIPE